MIPRVFICANAEKVIWTLTNPCHPMFGFDSGQNSESQVEISQSCVNELVLSFGLGRLVLRLGRIFDMFILFSGVCSV